MTVYKYVTSARIDILRNGRVRFTQAAALNDPFEAHPCFTVLRDSVEKRQRALLANLEGRLDGRDMVAGSILIPRRVRDAVAKFQRDLATDWPMLSLTRKRNNLLMWSHYAESHRGFVIGFDDNNSFFHREAPRTMSPLLEVQYALNRPIVPRFEEMPSDLHETVFLTKSEQWAYEEELRMFAQPHIANVTERDDRGFALYLFDLPSDVFAEIIFGLAMPKEEKRRVAAIAREKYPQTKVYEARLSEVDFDLDIVDYNER